jgi:hypothetical protein
LTGVVAAVVVVMGGLLVTQITGNGDGQPSPPSPTGTPRPQIPQPALFALKVPHRGQWHIRVDVDDTAHYENTGKGYFIVPPPFEIPFGSRVHTEIEYQIVFTIPDMNEDGVTFEEVQDYSSQADYVNALPQTFYALYTEDNHFLGVRDEVAIDLLIQRSGLQLEEWEFPED